MTIETSAAATTGANRPTIEPARFRKVLGHYPTGVCVVAAIDDDGKAVGMAVGSFVSVSLHPPLMFFQGGYGGFTPLPVDQLASDY